MKLKNILTWRIFNINPSIYKDLINTWNIKNFEEIIEDKIETENIENPYYNLDLEKKLDETILDEIKDDNLNED